MNNVYIPYYQTDVEESTFSVKQRILEKIRDRFASIPLRSISVEDVQNFRTWLLTSQENGGAGYAQSYASLILECFAKAWIKL